MKLNKLLTLVLVTVLCSAFVMLKLPVAAQTIVECPCKGGVTSLSLKNLTGIGQYFVMQKTGQNGEIYFEGFVPADGVFTGTNGGLTFHGGDTSIKIGSPIHTEFIIHTSCSQPLNVGMVFGTSTEPALVEVIAYESLDGGVCPAVCSPNTITGAADLTYSGTTVTWNITHTGADDVLLDSIELSWPDANGNLVSVTFNGNVVWTGSAGEPFVNSTWLPGSELDRTLESGATVDVELEFVSTAVTPSAGDSYTFRLVFYGQDCEVSAARVVSFTASPVPDNHLATILFLVSLVSIMVAGYFALIHKPESI